jgi:hypothetical protein
MRSCLRLGSLTAWAWWAGDLSASHASVVRSDPRTGKVVRMTVVRNHSGLADAVDWIAAQYALPPELVHSVIRAGKPAAAPDGGGHIQEVVLPDGSVQYVLREPL